MSNVRPDAAPPPAAFIPSMSTTDTSTYPNGCWVRRVIRISGASKAELLSQLQLAGIRLNEAAHALFADDRFTTSTVSSLVEVAELSVASIGCRKGGCFAEIVEQAAAN